MGFCITFAPLGLDLFFVLYGEFHHYTPVGAGLLAKASCQAPPMLDVPPSSRASPLPQGQGVPLG
ncbi:hypothetical protein CP335_01290 [Pseudomonas fluorescens]|uniref:Uncharacterized protein n=1 Tax=Pseudomonas fluorescens TaxID=294 RepID=A0A854XQ96_PSEFL|nr:hypothetical protein CP335_01290 [Pseudomonas fluorescens]